MSSSIAGGLKKLVVGIYEHEMKPFTDQPVAALPAEWTTEANKITFLLSQAKLPNVLIAYLMPNHVRTMKEWFVFSGIQNFKIPTGVVEEYCKQTITHLRKRGIVVVKSDPKESSRITLMQHIFSTAWLRATLEERLAILKECKKLDQERFKGWGEYSKAQELYFRVTDATANFINSTYRTLTIVLLAAAIFTLTQHYSHKIFNKSMDYLIRHFYKSNSPLSIALSATLSACCLVGLTIFSVGTHHIFVRGAARGAENFVREVGIKTTARNVALLRDGVPHALPTWLEMDQAMFQKQPQTLPVKPLGQD